MEDPDFGNCAELPLVLPVVGLDVLVAHFGFTRQHVIEKLFHAQGGFAFIVEAVPLSLQHVPACPVLPVFPERFFKAGLNLGLWKFGKTVLGFLGDEDRVDNFLLGLGHEFGIPLAAGYLQAGLRLGLDPGEGILKKIGIDELSVDAKHIRQVAVEWQIANSKE